jgi:hypothetical protein
MLFAVFILYLLVAALMAEPSTATAAQSLIHLHLSSLSLASVRYAINNTATNSGIFHCGTVNSSALQVRARLSFTKL